jgi:hypothetical protein
MMRLQAMAVLAALSADVATAQMRPPSLTGTWEWTRKINNCSEQHIYRDDGTATIRSGDERSDLTFRLAWSPEPNGRYKLTMTTVKDHGGRNCAESDEDQTGRTDELYVLFSQSRETMLVCRSPAGSDCIGPLRRTAP